LQACSLNILRRVSCTGNRNPIPRDRAWQPAINNKLAPKPTPKPNPNPSFSFNP